MSRFSRAVSIADLRLVARRRLPRAVFEFIDGGAGDEVTRDANETGFDRWWLDPRVAVDASTVDTSVDVLGFSSRLPLMLAPTGHAGLYWPDGEIAAARAAARAGIPFCLSTNSVASIEDVAAAVPEAKRWFQPTRAGAGAWRVPTSCHAEASMCPSFSDRAAHSFVAQSVALMAGCWGRGTRCPSAKRPVPPSSQGSCR